MALTRKNALFTGHEVGAENWALLASLVATCKMSDVNPVDYIAETFQKPDRGAHALAVPENVKPRRIGDRLSAYGSHRFRELQAREPRG